MRQISSVEEERIRKGQEHSTEEMSPTERGLVDQQSPCVQEAADRRDAQRFFKELKAMYGSSCNGITPVRTSNGRSLIVESTLILQRWAGHFSTAWNQPSNIDDTTIEDIHSIPEM